MVRGLELFRKHFANFQDQYVLIGGTACTLAMEEAGLPFRATKDLDIVLCIEALNEEFVVAFKEFIKKGQYQNRQKSTGRVVFYRFFDPSNNDFPFMLELFSRVPDAIKLEHREKLTSIPIHESKTSLSAILLNDIYYDFIHAGKIEINGLPTIGAAHLIPLKAKAWLELTYERLRNESVVNSNDIKKHKNDILRLHQLLSIDDSIILPEQIKSDLVQFLQKNENNHIDLKTLGLKNIQYRDILDRLKIIYSLVS